MLIPNSTKILMVLAHPDDEIIFGWPIFQDLNIQKEVLICSSDFYNPERQWCAHRKFALEEVCHEFNVPVTTLDYNSEFYRLETRKEGLSKCHAHIEEEIKNKDFDMIFTHNPLGEYGHIDHKMVFEVVHQTVAAPILITDICLKSNWPSVSKIPKNIKKLYYNKAVSSHVLNEDIYRKCEAIYRKHKVWTWSESPVRECKLYKI